jgi:trehalose 6-phosphate phosphatase
MDAKAMQDIDASAHMNRAEAVLGDPRRCALFIDIDGTLLGMAPTPDAVQVPPRLVPLLGHLVDRLDGALALLTGRRIANADRLFDPLRLIASGVHGTELRRERDGRIVVLAPPLSPGVAAAIDEAGCVAEGILVERKGSGIAVHYRHAPSAGQSLQSRLEAIVAASDDLVLHRGRMVLEVGPRDYSKGASLAYLAARPPFAGRRPIMVGDDVADESALVEAERLGGVALRVAGEHFSRETADFDGVRSVHDWLEALAAALGANCRVGAV